MQQDINFSTFQSFHTAVSASIPIGADVVVVDASSGPVTITLPSPLLRDNSRQLGTVRILKVDASANPVTIATPDGVIVGKALLQTQHASATRIPDGCGRWFIF